MFLTDRIHKAIIFAGRKHKTQLRKGTDIPYLVHPMEVMGILIANKCSENVIIAGILHDTLEDTDTTPEEIKELFGNDILAIVQTESEDKSKTWKERKQHTVNQLPNESLETQLVCCADKLSNIKSILADKKESGENVWKRFNASKENLEWYYKSIAENLTKVKAYPMWTELFDTVRKVFEQKPPFNSETKKLLEKLYASSRSVLPEYDSQTHLIHITADALSFYQNEEGLSYNLSDDDILEIDKFDGTDEVYSIELEGAEEWLSEEMTVLGDFESGHEDSEYVKNFDWDDWNMRGLEFAQKIRSILPETFEVRYSTAHEDKKHGGCSIII